MLSVAKEPMIGIRASMSDSLPNPANLLSQILEALNNLYRFGFLQDLKDLLAKLIRKFRNDGMYRVLAYESDLELIDTKGYKARFCKKEKLQYLQDNIIAYQDQAWGDGKILVDYQCKPGIPVDCYRLGYKTYVLISLREVKSKGDIDEFISRWKIQKGFFKSTGFWGTEINHDTDYVKTQVMFPKTRPPQRITVVEKNRQKTTLLGQNNIKQLPDGKWLVTWEKSKPKLHEQYIMNWAW
jgi:hypothetical protein